MAVAGAGVFGRNHLRVLHELQATAAGVELAAVVEPDAARVAEAANYGSPVFSSIEKMLAAEQRLDAAIVAVPTVKHCAVAGALLDAGLDVLVEKPLAANLEEADDLIARAERGGRILQPGHLERFNPAVLAVEPRLKRPMFFEAHRLSVFTPRSLDVDVVLDLMIHDLDIVLAVTPSPVREVRAVGLPIVSPRVDIANARVEFESGCVANFTASRVSTERVRKLRFFEPRQYVSIDYARQDLLVILMDERVPAEIAAAAAGGRLDAEILKKLMAGAPDGPAPGLSFAKPEVAAGEPLRLEIESFLQSVRTRREPKVTARQGREALKLALEIQAAMVAHAQRAGLGNFFRS
ncbi:MAG TPA: Gfo/Idh/MocA family oxidoreductase [Bryobacteraceae bacterium]|nr:Gfo/Idh/MocA family oxidoreductase [Bryobacteraceae bacterium]